MPAGKLKSQHGPLPTRLVSNISSNHFQKDRQIQKVRTKLGGGFVPIDRADELQATVKSTLYLDYFKLGLTKNWEPLVEPFQFLILYEKSKRRGDGITFNADCPLHVNFSSALVETIDDAINGFKLFQQQETTTKPRSNGPARPAMKSDPSFKTTSKKGLGPNSLTVVHNEANLIGETERVRGMSIYAE